MQKIAVVGPGRVGESTAQILAQQSLCRELVLLGTKESVARGVALDIQESAPLFGFDTRISGGADPALLSGADLVIITAGQARKPGMSRDELRDANLAVIRSIVDNVLRHAPQAMVLMVTNPVDVLTYATWRQTGWPRRRILGLSGVLDSARMASFVAQASGYSVRDITALVIGGHGDAMVPLPEYTCINGIPIKHLLDQAMIVRLIEHTRQGGAEILALKQTSSAYDSPAAAIAAMVEAMIRDRRRILPCVAILDGEYGQSNIAMGVPVVLGKTGVEKVIELPLTEAQSRALLRSSDAVRANLSGLS
jgi:malate dehydrogenase